MGAATVSPSLPSPFIALIVICSCTSFCKAPPVNPSYSQTAAGVPLPFYRGRITFALPTPAYIFIFQAFSLRDIFCATGTALQIFILQSRFPRSILSLLLTQPIEPKDQSRGIVTNCLDICESTRIVTHLLLQLRFTIEIP